MSLVHRLREPRGSVRPGLGRGLVIEPMRRRHLRAVLAIENRVYPKPWSPGVFDAELDQMRDGYRYYVVIRQGSTVLGYAGLLYSGDDAHVTNIAVDPDHRRAGLGARLLAHLAHHGRDAGFINLTLEVRVSNTGAQELYRKFGFVPAGVRKNYYEDVEDAIVMWCHDIGTDAYAARLAELESHHGN